MSDSESSKESARPVTIDEESLTELTENNTISDSIVIDKKRRQTIIPLSHQPKPIDAAKGSDFESNNGDNENELDFDSFILNNFNPYSGSENVVDWLVNTDKKFNLHKIPRKLRYIAIPLLIEGDAKIKYILNRNNIKSFDDFLEFLLTTYDVPEHNTRHFQSNPSSYPSNQNNFTHNSIIHKTISFEDQQKTTMNDFDLTDNLPPHPILRSTAIVDMGATRLTGDETENRSTVAPSSNISRHSSSLDQTTYVIHKAIIDNLIKNPKTFQGGKEDVKQWLEDIEQLFDTAQIPDSHKLDLIPYSLRGEARRWYKNTKATLTSWPVFVKELKEAFLSPFHEELAFKKLESYTQGINQPVRSFYNEVLKLCAETDPEMSESMKLRHLLKKTKPTLQYEIRKKKPTTTKQFLEYAKESEELLQLANINTELDTYDRNNSNTTNQIASTITSPQPNASNPRIDSTPFPIYDRKTNYNNYYNSNKFNNNRSNDYNFHSSQPFNSSRSSNSFNSPFRRNNSSYLSRQPVKSNQPFYSDIQRTNNNFRPVSSNNQYKSSYPHNSNTNNLNQANNQRHQVNNIIENHIAPSPQPTPLLSNSDMCTQCLETGHQASACSRF
ncbi:unnamed protein product [Rotaria sp. Silwood1]|nr:unnamed protein product [Rotaria sp. Silwood1]